jgi:hypothetical protein
MQLSINTRIAGDKTVFDWNSLRNNLNNYNDSSLWTEVYNDFYLARLNDRYLTPIKSIKDNGQYTGEGFSIMVIICSLVEFLETTYQGKNYRHRKKSDPPLGAFEYSKSEEIFIDFLTKQNPFNTQFDLQTSKEFYSHVRCGLLHEARTNGRWTILGCSENNTFIKKTTEEIIVYRDNFYEAIQIFIDNYKIELLSNTDRKDAFLRKYDKLCEI